MQQHRQLSLQEKLRCRKCGTPFQYSLQKGPLLSMINIAFPVDVFFCVGCMKSRYVWRKKKFDKE